MSKRKDMGISVNVQQILKLANDEAIKRKKCFVTTLEVIDQTFKIVFGEIKPTYENDPYFQAISPWFSNLTKKDKKSILASIKEEKEEYYETMEDANKELESPVVFEPRLNQLLDAAGTITEGLKRAPRVEFDVFFLAILQSDEEIITDICEEYNLDPKQLSISSPSSPEIENFAENFLDRLFKMGMDTAKKMTENKEAQGIMDEKNFEKFGESESVSGRELDPNSATPFLDQFSEDMIKKAKNNKYDPVIGREDVVDNIAEILCKRKKANVALVGVAGSGKSSIIERLAQRIVAGKVPEKLKDKRICSLNLNDLVAGTKYRGEYEERLQKIIKEVCTNKNIIIYIDEIHNLVGSGSSAGNGDGANILKPYLARGEFQCIGSTTNEEYRKYIEKDSALNRRFTQVEVLEPTNEETLKILNGVKGMYEKFHRVRFEKEVLENIVDWSSRYINDKHQPDKSIDILDLSGSLTAIKALSEVKVEDSEEVKELKNKIIAVKEQKRDAIMVNFDYELGEKLRYEEQKLQEELDKIEKTTKSENNNRKNWIEVTVEDVAQAISKVSKVPIDKINQTDRDRISKMKTELVKKVIGQDEAINTVVKNLQRSWLGLRQPNKPIFTGMFVGNTGTGKTLICKEIAKIFFGSEKNLIRIDCGELRDKSTVSKLTGTTAGYVGYDDEPLLLQVKRTPNCILLLDEIDKCDPSIYEIFMNILDEGYCILGDGTRVDFTNSVIIFTGNVGTKDLRASGRKLGFDNGNQQQKSEAIVKKAVEKMFKPEFLNRLSSIIVFNELGKQEMSKIFSIELDVIKDQLKKKKLSLKVTPKMKEYIISQVNLSYGARDLKRLINTFVVDPISEAILDKIEATKFTVKFNTETNAPEVISE